MSYRVLLYGLGRYDIGPYVKQFLFETETDPTTDWIEQTDSNEDFWIKRPDTTSETWIAVNDGNNG